MKHLKLLATIVCSVVIALMTTSCSSDSDKSSEIQLDNSYREACENGDFEKAHNIVNSFQTEVDKFAAENEMIKHSFWTGRDDSNWEKYKQLVKMYLGASEFVYSAEIRYLLSDVDEDCDKRVIFLINEMESQLARYGNDGNLSGNIKELADEILTRIKESAASMAQAMGHQELYTKINNMPKAQKKDKEDE